MLCDLCDSFLQAAESIARGQVPALWKKSSYPSLKPLGSYIDDLICRLSYFQEWIDKSPPKNHWISGFYFAQGFLTAVLQNYARKYQLAVDAVAFTYQFFEEPDADPQKQALFITQGDGTLIYGLYLEGASWNFQRRSLVES